MPQVANASVVAQQIARKVAQNVAAGVVGIVVWPVLYAQSTVIKRAVPIKRAKKKPRIRRAGSRVQPDRYCRVALVTRSRWAYSKARARALRAVRLGRPSFL